MLKRLVSEGGHAWAVPTWQMAPQCPLLTPGGSPELEEEGWEPVWWGLSLGTSWTWSPGLRGKMPFRPQAATPPHRFQTVPTAWADSLSPSHRTAVLVPTRLLGRPGVPVHTGGIQQSPPADWGVHAALVTACWCCVWAFQPLETPPLGGSSQGLPECCEGARGTPAPPAPRMADPIVFHLHLSLKPGGCRIALPPLCQAPEGATTVGPQWPMASPLPTGPRGDSGGCKVTASKGSVPSTPPEQQWDPPPMGTSPMRVPGIGGHPWIHLQAPWEQGPLGVSPPESTSLCTLLRTPNVQT